MELTCPKCHGAMRTYERNGITVDQCADCRGIFLDRGELERLVDAESRWHDAPAAAPSAASAPGAPTTSAAPATPSVGALVGEVLQQARAAKKGSGHSSYSGHPTRKKRSFLDELFG